jgi:hypothetical protein
MDLEIKDSSKLVTENEIMRSGGIIYDPSKDVDHTTPINLPNVEDIIDAVEKIFEFMCTDEMMTLNEEDRGEYEKKMEAQFPDFSSKYYSLFQMILSGEDISYLFKMLEYMDQVNKGTANFEDVQKQFGADLQEDFVYQADDIDTSNIDDSWMDAEGDNQSTKKKKKKKKKKK